LYTTFGKARRALARGMGLSTNNNPAKDAATGTRQLMLSVAARQTSYDDKAFQGQGMVLIPRFMKVRNAIWSELIADLRRMVEALGSRDSWDKERTGFRMGDFGQLMLICADSEGWMDEADDMLRQMAGVQTQQMGERNLFVWLLTDYLLANRTEEMQYHTQSWWVNTESEETGALRPIPFSSDIAIICLES
jgi:hypothetical protein